MLKPFEQDRDFRIEVTKNIDEKQLNSEFRGRYGSGWRRKLGSVLDIPETTITGWFKFGKYPPLARLAFGVLLNRPIRPPLSDGDKALAHEVRMAVARALHGHSEIKYPDRYPHFGELSHAIERCTQLQLDDVVDVIGPWPHGESSHLIFDITAVLESEPAPSNAAKKRLMALFPETTDSTESPTQEIDDAD